MKKIILIAMLCIAAISSKAQFNQGWDKAMNFGGAGADVEELRYVGDDLYFLARLMGKYQFAGVNYDAGAIGSYPDQDVVFGKITSSGTQVLLKRMKSVDLEALTGGGRIGVDGSLYILRTGTGTSKTIGGLNTPAYGLHLLKIDPTGNPAWIKKLNQFTDVEFGATIAPVPGIGGMQVKDNGNVYVIVKSHIVKGSTYPTRVLKLDSSGEEVWHYEMTSSSAGTAMAGILISDMPRQFVDDNGNLIFKVSTTGTISFNGEALPYEEPYVYGGFGNFKNWIIALNADGARKWSTSAYVIPTLYGVNPKTGDIYLNYSYSRQSPALPAAIAPFSSLPNIAPPPPLSYIPAVYAWSGLITLSADGNIVKTKANYIENNAYPTQFQIADNGRMLLYGPIGNGSILKSANSFITYNTSGFGAMEIDADLNSLAVFKLPGASALALKNNKFAFGGSFKTPLTVGSTSLTPNYVDTDFNTRFPAWASIKADVFIASGDLDNIPTSLASSTWLGNSTSWNDAANWSNGIPTAETKAVFASTPVNMPTVGSSPVAGQVVINAGVEVVLPPLLKVTDKIENNGKLLLPSSGSLSFSGFSASDITGTGELAFTGGNATWLFTKATSNTVSFEGTLYLSSTVAKLKFVGANAKLSGSPTVSSNAPDAISGYSSASYISGKLTRAIPSNGTCFFPVGDYNGFAPVTIETSALTGTSFLSVEPKTGSATNPAISIANSMVNSVLGDGYWQLTPDQAPVSGTYKISAEKNAYTNGVTDASRYVLLKRSTSDKPWQFQGTNEASSQTGGTITGTVVKNGKVTASLNNLNSFSDFVIAIGSNSIAAGQVISSSTWTGATDKVWNKASNWSNGVPGGTVDAIIPAGLSNYPETVTATDNSRNLAIANGAMLKLPYNFVASGTIENNGSIEITGGGTGNNFDGFGTKPYASLTGSGKLLLTDASPRNFRLNTDYSLEVNRPLAGTTLTISGKINGSVNIIAGTIYGQASSNPTLPAFTLNNTNSTLAISDPSISFINGTLIKAINSSGTYAFPMGYISGGSKYYNPLNLELNGVAGTTALTVAFNSSSSYQGVSFLNNGIPVNQILNGGFWRVSPDIAATGGTVNLSFELRGSTNTRTDVNDYVLIKTVYNGSSYESVKVDDALIVQNAGVVTVSINNQPAFTKVTDFAIGLKASVTQWKGTSSNNWSTAANWTNGVPSSLVKAVFVSGSPQYPSTIFSNSASVLEVGSGVSLKLDQYYSSPLGIINNGTIEVTGSQPFYGFNNTPSLLSGTGKLIFGANSPSSFHSNSQTINNSVEINRSADFLVNNAVIAGSLTITSGKVLTGSSGLTLSNPNSAITVSTGSYIAGTLNRAVNSSGTYVFPVGTANSFAPASIQLNNISGTQTISATFSEAAVSGAPNLTIGNAAVTQLLSAGSWTITPNAALTGGTYSVSLSAPQGSAAGADYVVLKRQSNNSFYPWMNEGTNAAAAINNGVVTASASGLNAFSQFGIGVVPAEVLPVSVTKFNVSTKSNTVLLTWQTERESNNDKFIVEKSVDGKLFHEVGEVKGKGESSQLQNYSFVDFTPAQGSNYYRLKQLDFNGAGTASEIKMLNFSLTGELLMIYPNPFTSVLNIKGVSPNDKIGGELFDMQGKLVWKGEFNRNVVNVPVSLSAGMYVLRILKNGDLLQTRQLIKE